MRTKDRPHMQCVPCVLITVLVLLGCSEKHDEPATSVPLAFVKQEVAVPQPASEAPVAPNPIAPSETSTHSKPPLALPDYMLALPFESVAMYPGALAVSADGTVAAHIALDGAIVVWDARTFETLETIPPDGDEARRASALALSADGDLLAIGRFDSLVVVRSRREPKTARELQGHSGAITALAFSPDGRLLASGGDDATTLVWNLSTGRRHHAFDSQFENSSRGGLVVGLGFSGDSRALIVNEWYSRQYDDERGMTLWDLDEGIEIGTRILAPPNIQWAMRSGQALGGNNWLLAYTTPDGLALERLDECETSRKIAGPAVADPTLQTGRYASTVLADPQGRWVGALDDLRLMLYAATDGAAPVPLELPARAITLIPHLDGKRIFALAVKDEQYLFGRDLETVTPGALYVIAVPETVRRYPPITFEADAVRCPPSAIAREQWSFRLPERAPALPVIARLASPGEMPSPQDSDSRDNRQRINPPNGLHFADDGLYVLHHAYSDAQSGVVVWDLAAQRILRSHFPRYVGEHVVRLRKGWATERNGRLLDLLTGHLLLDVAPIVAESGTMVHFTTDAETGEIYRLMDGRLKRYGADAKLPPPGTREGIEVISVAARNGNLAIMYLDGSGEVWNLRTAESRPLIKLFPSPPEIGTCRIERVSKLSANGQFLQSEWGCLDSPIEYPITDLSTATEIASGPVLGPFPKHSTRVVVPDARASQLAVLDLAKNDLLLRLPRHAARDSNGNYRDLVATISDDGRLVASASQDGLVRVSDIDAKRVVGEVTASGRVTALSFDPTGQSLAVSAESGEVLVLDTKARTVP